MTTEELIELGAFANKEDIAKGLKSAIKVTKESAELTDEEIRECIHQIDPNKTDMFMSFARAILRKAQEK